MRVEDDDTIIITDAWISEAVTAGISIPVLFKPYQNHGLNMVDGGLKDMVPVDLLRVMGAEYVLGIDLQAGI